jgi:hypothetical protein
MAHSWEACASLISMFQFQDIRSAKPPAEKGIYVIRVAGRGEPVLTMVQNVGLVNILDSIGWPQVTKYVQSRINRLLRVDDCAVIYVGSAAPGATSSNTLRGRHQEFANRHTAMYPVWALLYFGWHLEFGWLVLDRPKDAEAELKQKYKSLHDGRLPALVER